MSDQYESAALLDEVWSAVTGVVQRASADDLRRPTRTDWTVRELLVHLLLDAQRALVALSTPAGGFPDTDRVSYWRAWRPRDEAAAAHATWVRSVAAAYPDDASLVAHWTTTSAAAIHAVRVAEPDVVETQGHSMMVAELIDTLVVEATVHYLDLTVELDAPPPAPAGGLARVRVVLDGLLGQPEPCGWSDEEYALKGTGRLPLTDAEGAALDEAAGRFPLFG